LKTVSFQEKFRQGRFGPAFLLCARRGAKKEKAWGFSPQALPGTLCDADLFELQSASRNYSRISHTTRQVKGNTGFPARVGAG
jgi:hypothetical protein